MVEIYISQAEIVDDIDVVDVMGEGNGMDISDLDDAKKCFVDFQLLNATTT